MVKFQTLFIVYLFFFILKGFLGTERQFSSRYSRPIIASRGTGTSTSVSRESLEAGALAMEALHRQVPIL